MENYPQRESWHLKYFNGAAPANRTISSNLIQNLTSTALSPISVQSQSKPPTPTSEHIIPTMGLFSSSETSTFAAKTKVSADGTPEAPNRNERAHCWEARDAFFACLDQNKIVDSITNHSVARERCGKEDLVFEKNCASSWVQYFKKRRVMEFRRNETLEKLKAEGAQVLPGRDSRAGEPPR